MGDEKLVWNLDSILPVDQFDSFYKETEVKLEEYAKAVESLSPKMSVKDFKKFLELDDSLLRNLSRLGYMPELISATDQSSEKARVMQGQASNLAAKSEQISTKVKLWLQGKLPDREVLVDKNAKRLFAADPNEEYSLKYLRDAGRHSLSLDGENALTMKEASVGGSEWCKLRALITSKFRYNFKPKGVYEVKVIETQAELMKYVYSSKPEEREAAYTALFEPFHQNLDELSMIYRAVVKDWVLTSQLKNFKSPIARRNFANQIPDKAIETLMQVCTENIGIYHDFFRWKAKALGMDKLKRFDIYAPLNADDESISFSDSMDLVLDTYDKFHPGFGKKAREILNAGNIDSHPSKVKVSGAFCATVTPDLPPFVLLNFSGKERDVSTIAHELGHGIHSLYARNLSSSTQHAPLPLAETASTFGEMLLFERLLAKADDETKVSMLSKKMADSFATVIRQNYFVKFEIAAHEAIMKGATPEELSDIYFKQLEEQFGDSVSLDSMFKYEWSYIPHMVNTPFYCYAYSFGDLLSLALYSKYKTEGKSFIPKLEKILSSGSSRDPQEVLKEVGVDMTSKNFWQGSFDLIRDWQNQLNKYSK